VEKIQSKGGLARAEVLSPEERSEIASQAAAARWNLPRATHEGDLQLGDYVIHCAVLDTGQRVLTQSDFMKALGRARQAKGREHYDGDVNLPAFLTAKNLKPFIDKDLHVTSSQIEFKPLKGSKAFGYPADLLPKVCEVFLRARDEGVLAHTQMHVAKQADVLMRALAHVGIAALVDEATGYQEVRDRMALQKILEKYITDEWAKWTKTFPDEFYKHLFRLKGLQYPPQNMKKPSYVGHWTNDFIYSRLAPGVLEALRKMNPRDDTSGSRRRKHHQHLTRDYGHPALKEHLSNVIFLMRSCATDTEFKHRLDAAAPKHGETAMLPLASSH
jgi:hypothetical protein